MVIFNNTFEAIKKYNYLIQFKHNNREAYGFGLKEALIHAMHDQLNNAMDTDIMGRECGERQ